MHWMLGCFVCTMHLHICSNYSRHANATFGLRNVLTRGQY